MDLSNKQVNLQDILSWVTSNDFTINLTNEKICFILAIFTLQHTSESELNEDVLIDLYRQVLHFTKDLDVEQELSDAQVAARANKLINDMVQIGRAHV